jgi:phage terminase large subunit-like protein
MPSQQNAFFTRHLNITGELPITGGFRLAPGRQREYPDLDLEDFTRRDRCYIGIDLALRSDIAALMIAFPPAGARDHWAVFGRYYLPEQTVNRSENTHYQGWETEGRMFATPGAVTDFDYIIDQLEDYASRFDVIDIVLDPYHAGPLVNTIEKRACPLPRDPPGHPTCRPRWSRWGWCSIKIRHDGDRSSLDEQRDRPRVGR